MPRSKRVRETPLTQTDSRSTKAHKTALIQQVRDAVDTYESIYVLSFENMRASKLKDVRMQFRKDSRVLLGKQKLIQIALGRSVEDEYADNLRYVSKHFVGGDRGLLLTNRSEEEIKSFFAKFVEPDFARAGHEVEDDISIQVEQLKTFPSSMVEPLRKLGLPVKLKNGVLLFQNDQATHRLCKSGEQLSVEKCQLLNHFGIKLAKFRVSLECRWTKEGEYKPL